MKKQLFVLACFALLAACKKENTTTTPVTNQEEDWLINPATGWKHVQTVSYEKPADALAGNDRFTGYDLTQIGNEIGILYSANYYMPEKGPIRQFYKIKFKENDSNIGSGAKLKIYGTTSRSTFHSQLIPNTLIPVFINYSGSDRIELYDENDSKMGFMLFNNAKEISYHYTKDGDFVAGGIDDTYANHFWTLKYPQTVPTSFPDIKAAKDRADFKSSFSMPVKATDGNYYVFAIGKVGAALAYQVVRLQPEKDYNTTINYEIVKQGTLDGIAPQNLRTAAQSLVTYDVQGDVLHFVLADFNGINNPRINKLYGYRWNRQTNSFEKLWETPEVSLNLSKAILDNKKAEYKYRENRLTPDGGFYTLFTKEKFGEPEVGTQYTILYTANATGIKELGKLDELYGNSVSITNCRYINNAYYALVYPSETTTFKLGDRKFHLELVKLNP